MYNYHNGSEVEVLSCDLPLDKIPELCLSFSDHEAVSATLNITKSSTVAKMEMNNIDRIRTLEETGRIIAGDFLRLRNDRILYSVVFIVLLFVVLGTLHINLSLGLQVSLGILHIVLTIVMLFCLIMATVWNTIEVNSLKSYLSKTCDVIDKTSTVICSVTKKMFTEDNGQAYICADPSLCKAQDYNFASAPICGKLLKSAYICADPSLCKAQDYNFASAPICGKLLKSSDFSESGLNTFVFENAFPSEVSKKFTSCYKELLALNDKE
uniref:Uncharacterized protein n=1 Tax=Strigamia maritima TaxID=126957 RepID=T1IRT7_STRMM